MKTVRSMLTTTEMRLKSQTRPSYVDSTSSSSMVLLDNYDINARCSTNSNEKVNKSCFNFNKGSCRLGKHCKFLHNGVHDNSYLWLNSVPPFDGVPHLTVRSLASDATQLRHLESRLA
nr:hybrid signal transduction histidine kinase M [Tanacetum cinerariifolium]